MKILLDIYYYQQRKFYPGGGKTCTLKVNQ